MVEPVAAQPASRNEMLRVNLEARQAELAKLTRRPGQKGPQSPIEEMLLAAMRRRSGMPEPVAQFEILVDNRLLTVPDFAYPDQKIAVFCDGFAFHGNVDTLELDSFKRNKLQELGWTVLTYWGRTINRAADKCAAEIFQVFSSRQQTCL